MAEADLSPAGPRNAKTKAFWQAQGYRFEGDPGGDLTFEEYLRACLVTAVENEVDDAMGRMPCGIGEGQDGP